MKMSKTVFILFILCLFSFPAFAQYEKKDSFYFMKDDGIFSPEEKDEEAEYIKRQCEISTVQKEYYDCSCIAGAFRIKRDEPKLMPQKKIVYDLYQDPETKCVDPLKIAGNMFEFCERYTEVFRPRKKHNNEYCECVANTIANDFTRNPRLKTRYIENIRINALTSCDAKIKKDLP